MIFIWSAALPLEFMGSPVKIKTDFSHRCPLSVLKSCLDYFICPIQFFPPVRPAECPSSGLIGVNYLAGNPFAFLIGDPSQIMPYRRNSRRFMLDIIHHLPDQFLFVADWYLQRTQGLLPVL